MNNYFELKRSIDDHYQLKEQNCYMRSDISGPLSLKPADIEASNYLYAAEQAKLGHLLMNNYQMQPPPYPISFPGSEDSNKIQQIDKFLKNSAYSEQNTSSAVSSYLTQLSQQRNQFTFMQNPHIQPPSSYYTLTPASSTTSLNDFALLNSTNLLEKSIGQQQQQVQQRKSTLSRTDSKKRARTTTTNSITENSDIDTKTANLKKTVNATAKAQSGAAAATAPAAPRRRGRPPKNAAQSTSQLPAVSTEVTTKTTDEVVAPVTNDTMPTKKLLDSGVSRAKAASGLVRSNSNVDSTTASKKTGSAKLIKSLINKSSSNSNLQKSKIQTTEMSKTNENNNPEVPATTQTNLNNVVTNTNNTNNNPLVNKSNVVLNNVNTNVNTQSQITGYLVDKVNTANQIDLAASRGLNTQEYTALKIAGVNIIKSNAENNTSQLNSVNQSIYTGYYNKVKSIRSSADLSITTEDYSQQKQTNEPSTPMPKLSWANNHDLWETMRKKDTKYQHDCFYLKRHSNIEPQMRAILLDWLVEISYAYRLHRETWHLALEYMDRFMTCSKQQMRVDRLQLIGMTCLFLAAKVEEIYPPKLKELASHMENYSNNNEDAISQFELFILKTLNWEISPVTANTWLMTYIQIASLNYYSLMNNQTTTQDQPLNSHMVMPLNIYKNSNANKLNATLQQQQFYIKNYMKSVTLLDLCMFEMDSMKFSYSVLAASAMYHMISYTSSPQDQYTTPLNQGSSAQLAARIVEMSTGYKLYELDACIKWMYPFADVCKDILTEEKMTFVKTFSSVEQEDSHNIQLYHQNLELLKEAQSRKTPCKFYSNQNVAPIILTPPDSHRKFSSSAATTCPANTSYKN